MLAPLVTQCIALLPVVFACTAVLVAIAGQLAHAFTHRVQA